MKTKKQWILIAAAILTTIGLLPFFPANAAGILKTTMDQMLQASEFVFEGRVLSVESRHTGPKRIHTFVTCDINEIIKGEYPEPIIILRFLGGTVGNLTMAVSDMQVPRDGERGIYFVESLHRNQIHPLYGWSQGHFIVAADPAGTDRMMTVKHQPVTGLFFGTNNKKRALREPSTGVAEGVSVLPNRQNTKGLTLDEFKQTLRNILNGTYTLAHGLTHPTISDGWPSMNWATPWAWDMKTAGLTRLWPRMQETSILPMKQPSSPQGM